MAEPGPWRGDAIRRGLAVELGTNVADRLQQLADDLVARVDEDDPDPRTRNNQLAFVALCIGGNMEKEPEGG